MTELLERSARVVRHFAADRALEVAALQGSPVLGVLLADAGLDRGAPERAALLLAGSLLLTAHVFVWNDWAGHGGDVRDPRREEHVFSRKGIAPRQVATFASALFLSATALFAFVGVRAVLLGSTIAALGILYSSSRNLGKGRPFVATLHHLAGGTLHFLLGYTLSRPVDSRGLAIGAFFGLVFAAGHLNQEIRDHDGDLRNGIRTSAVVYGRRNAFLASLALFTAAYALLALLATIGFLPRILLVGLILWPIQLGWSLRALKRGLDAEAALEVQRTYRILFAAIGIAMAITATLGRR